MLWPVWRRIQTTQSAIKNEEINLQVYAKLANSHTEIVNYIPPDENPLSFMDKNNLHYSKYTTTKRLQKW